MDEDPEFERRIEALSRTSYEIVRKELNEPYSWDELPESEREHHRDLSRRLVAKMGGFGKFGKRN